jgi:hypothetical protein
LDLRTHGGTVLKVFLQEPYVKLGSVTVHSIELVKLHEKPLAIAGGVLEGMLRY